MLSDMKIVASFARSVLTIHILEEDFPPNKRYISAAKVHR